MNNYTTDVSEVLRKIIVLGLGSICFEQSGGGFLSSRRLR